MKTLEPTYGGHNRPEREPRISNSALGMVAFIGTELMFFAALISAFLIISSAAEAWPPEGQPRLPVRCWRPFWVFYYLSKKDGPLPEVQVSFSFSVVPPTIPVSTTPVPVVPP